MGAAGGGDDIGLVTNDVPLFQALHKRMLILIGNEVTALGIHALLERITHFGQYSITRAGLSPERLLVSIGGTASLGIGFSCGIRLGSERLGGRRIHLPLNGFLALHAGDLTAQVGDLLLHLGIGGIVLSGQSAVFLAVGFQERFGAFP